MFGRSGRLEGDVSRRGGKGVKRTSGETEEDEIEDTYPLGGDVAVRRELVDLLGGQVGEGDVCVFVGHDQFDTGEKG